METPLTSIRRDAGALSCSSAVQPPLPQCPARLSAALSSEPKLAAQFSRNSLRRETTTARIFSSAIPLIPTDTPSLLKPLIDKGSEL
ncbi:MAG: hypothetical protein QXX12_08030 [Nanopusillaceae archaeon]